MASKKLTEKQQLAVIAELYKKLDKQLLAMEATCDKAVARLDKMLKALPTAHECR